jgi:antirestriction protein
MSDKLKAQFSELSKDATTAKDMAQAIQGLPAGGETQIADFIAELCREKNIDPKAPEIMDTYRQTAEYKAAQEAEKTKQALDHAVGNIEGFVSTFRENQKAGATPTSEQLAADMRNINKLLAGVGEAGNKSPFITFENYLDERVNKKYWAEFSPALFDGLPFPDGTLSAIGAAPGGGKSAALVNLCRELLTTEPTNNPNPREAELKHDINANRNILFLSAEMTIPDILDRLVHCLAWQAGKDNPQYGLKGVTHTNTDYWRALKTITGQAPEYLTFTPEEHRRGQLYKNILEKYIRPAWGNRLKIAYVRGYRTFDEIANIILNNAAPGSLVLMDYLQLFPPTTADIGIDGSAGSSCPRYLQIRHVIDASIMAAEKTQSVIIAAAQLGRTERKEGSNQGADDTQGWRESGDIEQSAWNLIKMFLETNENNPDEMQLSYRIAKCRSAPALGKGYILNWIPGYQYMSITEHPKALPHWKQKPPKQQIKKEKTQGVKKGNRHVE